MLPTPNHSSLDADALQLSDDDEPLLTQPPSLLNTVRSPSPVDTHQSFLDSIRRTIDNENEFNLKNTQYTTPPIPSPIIIPDFVYSAILQELKVTWGCNRPRAYQIEALFHLAYTKLDMMYLIRKTGEGKSLVMQAMASIFKGVTVSMVPLLGLGSDQDDKCNGIKAVGVESYHLDEYRNNNATELRQHLDELTRDDRTTIILFISPQQLSRNSYWRGVLMSLARRGCISAVCIDEAHSPVQNYESFRPEFKAAMESLNALVAVSRRNNPDTFYVPILVMSATFTIPDQQAFNNLIGRFPSLVVWGDMSRRNISFHVNIAGDPLHSFSKDWINIAITQPTRQSLVYSNTKAACDGPILNRLLAACKNVPFDNGSFLSLTGDCGIMLKSYLMACFCGDGRLNGDDSVGEDNDSSTIPIWCMPCTSAANCGVSSKNCTTCFRIGPPPSWHEMVQEMGRVDRLHNMEHGTNSYRVYINLNTFLSLWIRVHSEPNVNVQVRQMEHLMEILTLLVLPQQCYHDAIEHHFEHPTLYESNPSCGKRCSFCDGSYRHICGDVSNNHLISLLTTRVFEKGNVSAMSLISMINSPSNRRVKDAIWLGKKDVTPGNVHALILMLIASNIIHLHLPPSVSTQKLVPISKVEVSLTKQPSIADVEFETFALYLDSNWDRIPWK